MRIYDMGAKLQRRQSTLLVKWRALTNQNQA